jgi:RIO kinase 1
MSDDLSKKLESKIDSELRAKSSRGGLEDGFKKNKVMNEVLDKPAMLTIYGMINAHIISYVNGVVSAGKESVVFWAVDGDGCDVALKVYLVAASNFKRRWPYILGDPRFGRIRGGTRNLIKLWARKEYRNMLQCFEAGIPVPRPIHVSGSVLAMSFVGDGGSPARTLQASEVDAADYDMAFSIMSRMYHGARLVHGDYSGYNIFKTDGGLVAFDLGSAVDVRHASADVLLRRDIDNMTRFFVRKGLTVPDPEDAYREIKG